MEITDSVRINLDRYLNLFAGEGFTEDAKVFGRYLDRYGASGEVSFYAEASHPGEVMLIALDIGDGLSGIIRFTKNGRLHDGLSGRSRDLTTKRFARLFIWGLFGVHGETGPLLRPDITILKGILAVRCRYDHDA